MSENHKYCVWIKKKRIPCRFPKKWAEHQHSLLFCIACLFGWHLELSELKEASGSEG